MKPKSLVKLSNLIGIISIIMLIYWVFIFISVTVFGLKIFKENITETFIMSIMGILALLAGALFINIMFNLTRIAEKESEEKKELSKSTSKRLSYLFIASFPVILGLLIAGDYITSQKKEKLLIKAAESAIQFNEKRTDSFFSYSFNRKWITKTTETLEILSNSDKNFPYVRIIIKDSIDKSPVFLSFGNSYMPESDTIAPAKKDFIMPTSVQERAYLNMIFDKGDSNIQFAAKDGRYELFYPVIRNGKRIVVYFSEYQRYGKIGS
ncbi:peptidase [Solitalea longa]|uniref:Peptidase n=1 Tax=Solitalea longa TaxID=2079460 RepID=A0A2S5A8U3_9SPHI|nr:peptidase [Solitalea longa]POY38924.1 peptidase [Solitalea longa]